MTNPITHVPATSTRPVFVQYVRNNRHDPYGVVVVDEHGRLGLSLCHRRDAFNKKVGVAIALRRAEAEGSAHIFVTRLTESTANRFARALARAERAIQRMNTPQLESA